jgi:glucan phosphoethanolaminetransferase (alkaline phosphatase superfamily)
MQSPVIILLLFWAYAVIQIIHYCKKGYKKEIVIFIVLFVISFVYICSFIYNLSLKTPAEFITDIYRPISEFLFNTSIN